MKTIDFNGVTYGFLSFASSVRRFGIIESDAYAHFMQLSTNRLFDDCVHLFTKT